MADHRAGRADQQPTAPPSVLDHESAVDQACVPDQPASALPRPEWTSLGGEAFAELADRLHRRPSGREFQAALALKVDELIAANQIPANTRTPSLSSVKRIRATIESQAAARQGRSVDGNRSDGTQ